MNTGSCSRNSAGLLTAALLWLLGPACAPAGAKGPEYRTFASSGTRPALLEVFVSQGCSSCPPAERWLNTLAESPGLWKEFIPVVFHVDYWDHLGWKDRFGSSDFSRRQRRYARAGAVGSVYTPGFVVNGKEWPGWFKKEPPPKSAAGGGHLSARLSASRLAVAYDGKKTDLRLNVAVLGFGLTTKITAGENGGMELKEDFTVLAFETHPSGKGKWEVTLPSVPRAGAARYALALWVSAGDDPAPLQAAAGWLPDGVLGPRTEPAADSTGNGSAL